MIVRSADNRLKSIAEDGGVDVFLLEDINCDHCGLTVPRALVSPPCEPSFCCIGCAMAWQLIHGSGLEAWYEMRETPQANIVRGGIGNDAAGRVSEFDDAAFQERVSENPFGLRTTTMALGGLHCAACIWLIEKLPVIVPGVVSASVNWGAGTLRLAWNPKVVRLSRIAETLGQLGYQPGLLNANHRLENRQKENRRHLIRIGIAAAAAGNNMLIAAALYLGMFQYMTHDIGTLLRVASCVVGLVSFLGPGRVFLVGAVAAIRTRTPHMDLPIALALVVGTLAGLINTVRGVGEIYFDSLSVLVFLLLLGRWIQFRQQNRATDAIEMLHRLTPPRARRITNGRVEVVPAVSLRPGDLVEVRPGDLIPVDGLVEGGQSFVDEQLLSGESAPLEKGVGDGVSAGTKNIDGLLTVRASRTGTKTRIGDIARLVQQATETRPKVVEWANRIAARFVIVVLVLSLLTLAGWMLIDPSVAVDRMVALLVVACPCALAMATPLAIAVAVGRLAQQGILVKSGDVLQQLNQPGMIWLDKTGTLTEGKMRVVGWEGEAKWLRVVSAVESHFSHPVARALSEESSTPGHKWPEITNPRSGPGGVTALFGNQQIIVGNLQLIQAHHAKIRDGFHRAAEEFTSQNLSPCWIAIDRIVVAVAGLGDVIRPDSSVTLGLLEKAGWKLGLLSGDHPEVVNTIARLLGTSFEEIFGARSPEQKLEIIRNSTKEMSPVVMVGDGVNDSAALAWATVGIAVHGGAEASLAAAPVYFGKPGLAPLVSLIQASRSTCQTIRVNFLISISYNVVGVGLAMTGMVNPLVAALLMPLSSITVIGFSLRSGNRWS